MQPWLARLDRHGTRLALATTCALPWLLIFARAAAEVALGGIALGLLLRMALMRDAGAMRAPWFLLAGAFWAWMVATTLLAGADAGRLLQALAWGRFPLAILAMASWILATPTARRWALASLGAAAGYVILEVWLQFLLGHGLRRAGNHMSGYLTGPFFRARVGNYLSMALWPVLLGAAVWLLRRGPWGMLAAFALAAALGAFGLSGQRGPLLTALGIMLAAALLLPEMRRPVLLALPAGIAVLVASALLSPVLFHRWFVHLPELLATFPETHYGQILARGLAIHQAHPWLGLGVDAFRHACPDPAYHIGWGGLGDGGGAAMCVTHAHNFYLEALVDGGWPGLILFGAMAAALLLAAARGLWRGPRDPVQLGAALALALAFWPVNSVNAFANIETAALRCLVAGLALALAACPLRSGSAAPAAPRPPAPAAPA